MDKFFPIIYVVSQQFHEMLIRLHLYSVTLFSTDASIRYYLYNGILWNGKFKCCG